MQGTSLEGPFPPNIVNLTSLSTLYVQSILYHPSFLTFWWLRSKNILAIQEDEWYKRYKWVPSTSEYEKYDPTVSEAHQSNFPAWFIGLFAPQRVDWFWWNNAGSWGIYQYLGSYQITLEIWSYICCKSVCSWFCALLGKWKFI